MFAQNERYTLSSAGFIYKDTFSSSKNKALECFRKLYGSKIWAKKAFYMHFHLFRSMLAKYLLIFVILAANAAAATVQGTVYNWQLNPQHDSIVEVSSNPKQVLVAKEGQYSFTIPEGKYVIKAYYKEGDAIVAKAEEPLVVKGEGTFNLDLILTDVVDEEIIDEADDIEIDDSGLETKPIFPYVIIIILAIMVFVGLFLAWKKKIEPETGSDDELDKVLKVIKSSSGRTTQKDIRKEIPLMSEAKVSLIITDLESKGIIRKIKKGRGNIIILEKK